MDTQKIVNLLHDFNKESSKFSTKNGMAFKIKIQIMLKKMKMVQASNLRQKLSNQVFVIIQMYISL